MFFKSPEWQFAIRDLTSVLGDCTMKRIDDHWFFRVSDNVGMLELTPVFLVYPPPNHEEPPTSGAAASLPRRVTPVDG